MKFEEMRVYNLGMNKLDILFPLAKQVWVFCLIYFNVPAIVWYWWLSVQNSRGRCDESGFGQVGQVQLAIVFFLIIYAAEALYLMPLRYCDMAYKREHGMVKTNCCGFLVSQIVRYLMTAILGEIPALYLASMILVGTGKYFFIAAFGGTMLAMIFIICIMPSLSCCAVRFTELPEEENDLKQKIQEYLESRGDDGCRVLMM